MEISEVIGTVTIRSKAIELRPTLQMLPELGKTS